MIQSDRSIAQRGSARLVLIAGFSILLLIGTAVVLLTRAPWQAAAPSTVIGSAPAQDGPVLPSDMPPMQQEQPAPAELLANSDIVPAVAADAEVATARPDIPLAPSHLDIRVVDAHGNPVAAAEVLVCARERLPTPEEMKELIASMSANGDRKPKSDTLKKWIAERPKDNATWEAPTSRHVTADDGSCGIDLAAAKVEIVASKEGLGTSGVWSSSSYERKPGAASPVVESMRLVDESAATLVLLPQGTITGVVRDARGLPVPRASIVVGNFLSGIGRNNNTRARLPGPVESDGEGRFRITMDAPTWLDLKAVVGDEETAEAHLRVESGEAVDTELRFPGAYAIRGLVVDGSGGPIEGVIVSPSGWNVPRNLKCETGADGTFLLEVSNPGEYELKAVRSGLVQDRPAHAVVDDANPLVALRIDLVESKTIAGRVHWSTGEPVPQAMISADVARRNLGEEYSGFGQVVDRIVRSEADGTFFIKDVHPTLVYSLRCFVSPAASATLDDVAPGAQDVEIILDREAAKGVSIRLAVVDADTGAPIPEFELMHASWINGVHSDAPPQAIKTPNGLHVLEGCRIGSSYGVIVRAEGYARCQVGPIVTRAEGADVTIALGRMASLRVAVVDVSGAPVAGANVLVAEALSNTFDRFDYFEAEVADGTGIAEFSNKAPGRYTVTASAGAKDSDLVRTALASGQTNNVRIVVANEVASGDLEVLVYQVDGTPFVAAAVMITHLTHFDGTSAWDSTDPFAENPLTDAAGRCEVTLAPGLYWVYVSPAANTFIPPKQAQIHSGRRATLEFEEGK